MVSIISSRLNKLSTEIIQINKFTSQYNMMSIIVYKSVFNIRQFSKKSVTVGLMVKKTISIVILLECNFTKKILTLDDQQWKTLMCNINYSSIINNLHTNCKRIKISDNMFYSVNLNQCTIKLYVNDNFITLSYIDLHRLKQLQQCIDSCIDEKQKKLVSFQSTFDTVYSSIKADITILPSSCQRDDFCSQYIQHFDFSICCIQNDDSCFMYEILQFHNNTLSEMI